jgi:hypothetical protein
MKCPICGSSELELVAGEQRLGGLLVRPDVLTCPACKAQAEQRRDELRYTFIPSPYSAAIGNELATFTQSTKVSTIGQDARQFLAQRNAIAEGRNQPCQTPFPLKKKEECVYISPKPGVLLEQRTQQNQPYWAEVEQGKVVLTTRAIYVGRRDAPLAKIHSANLSKHHLDFTRLDRKRPQRITFSNTQLAHLAVLALSRLIPNVLSPPRLSQTPFQQKPSPIRVNLSAPVNVPVGKGRRVRLPAFLVLILVPLMLCFLCVAGNLAVVTADRTLREIGALPTHTPTATQTATPTETLTPTVTNTPALTDTPVPTDTPTPRPGTNTPIPTDTSSAIPTEKTVIAIISAETLNVRSGPGVVYDIVGQVKKGDRLEVIAFNESRDWLKVTDGWVSTS